MSIRRILLIRFSSLGDLVLFLSVPRTLSRAFPDAEIEVVVRRDCAEVLLDQPGISRVHVLDPEDGVSGLESMARRLRRRDFDLVYDAHRSLRSRYLSLRIRPPRFLKIKKDTWRRLQLILLRRNRLSSGRTMVERFLEPLDALGVDRATARPEYFPGQETYRRVDKILQEIHAPYLALAPGAKWPMKRWHPEGFATIGDRFVENCGGSVLLVGGPGDRMEAERVAGTMTAEARNMVGKLAFKEAAALLSRCRGLVTNDSVMLHLAESVGTPAAALFGPTVPAFGYGPLLSGSTVIERSLRCRPCSRNGSRTCPLGTQECLTGLSGAEALDHLRNWKPLRGEPADVLEDVDRVTDGPAAASSTDDVQQSGSL